MADAQNRNPRYFPIDKGLYEVAPGLRPLGFDLGQGDFDKKIFQIDAQFSEFRKNKIASRKEKLGKYYATRDLRPAVEKAAVFFLIRRLPEESPEIFTLEPGDAWTLLCRHTQDVIRVSHQGELLDYRSSEDVGPQPTSALDALALQVPEDLALTSREGEKDWLSLLHLCSPSHWAAEDKIGLDFGAVHRPIPHIDKITRVSSQLVEAMIHKGPFVRFVWSFVTDQRLNHHPVAPPGWSQAEWKGRTFDLSQDCPFHFRVERQVIWGLPEVQASLFTIRISFWSGLEVKAHPVYRDQLLSALRSMSPESRVYKGVQHCFDDLVNWLQS
ncbi:MAG: heme-dependent oxidative N-demethylase subunit alpha family protein [Bdellovibrionales bacterium]